jgi:hypothetical protein
MILGTPAAAFAIEAKLEKNIDAKIQKATTLKWSFFAKNKL